jgi:hypothetical protein
MKPYQLTPQRHQDLPARIVKKGRFGAHIVHFPSLKNGRVVVCESRLEADFALGLEFDQSIESYLPQPEKISVWVDSVAQSYTPDFRVLCLDGTLRLIEVKPDAASENLRLQRLFAEVRKKEARQGRRFDVVYANDIRTEPRLGNMKWLYARAHTIWPRALEAVRERLERHGQETTWARLGCASNPALIGSVARLLLYGEIDVDLNAPLGPDSKIQRLRRR